MKDTRVYFSSLVVVALASIYAIFCLLETTFLSNHYIFAPERLHALSLNSIQQHGNDTKAIVVTIVDQLRADRSLAPYLSVDEEWVFNNAGGAMGAMYIIHASQSIINRRVVNSH